MADSSPDADLEEVRHAAFELRQRDPAEAVRVLRRLVKRGGEIEPLAHGALGEILLDDYADFDGAIHHFRKLLSLAPGMAAGALGLARALARNGEPYPAQEAYLVAVRELQALVRAARDGAGAEEIAGVDEAVLTALDAAVEERELCLEQGGIAPRTNLDSELLSWAEEMRLFDDPDDPEDLDDWVRFAQLRGVLEALDGRTEEALAQVDRIGGRFPEGVRAHLRSLVLEAAGDHSRAADEALGSIRAGSRSGPDERLRCAALLAEVKRVPEARKVLEELREAARQSEWPQELQAEVLSRVDGHLQELAANGLVTLGRKGSTS